MVDRINFGQLSDVIELPDLIEIQTRSYLEFLQMDAAPNKRKSVGLQAVFKEVFPIVGYDGKCTLDFVKYEVTPPKQSAFESLKEGEHGQRPSTSAAQTRSGLNTRSRPRSSSNHSG